MSSLDLKYAPERQAELQENISIVQAEIDQAGSSKARLVPISKLKPASDIQALYDAGHRHFGENYIQELVDKAEVLPKDIAWHFVGSLQSNKAKLAASIPNLFVLETLSSTKVADILQKSLTPENRHLNVYLQINTSGEDSKSGLPPLSPSSPSSSSTSNPTSNSAPNANPSSTSDPDPTPSSTSPPSLALALHVLRSCPNLHLLGLMTIGSYEASHDPSKPNPDFTSLKDTRRELVRLLANEGEQVQEADLELSMGMSADFVQAVKEGSSSVRVGTRIFGERPKRT